MAASSPGASDDPPVVDGVVPGLVLDGEAVVAGPAAFCDPAHPANSRPAATAAPRPERTVRLTRAPFVCPIDKANTVLRPVIRRIEPQATGLVAGDRATLPG